MGNDRLHVGAVLLKPCLAWLQSDTYVHTRIERSPWGSSFRRRIPTKRGMCLYRKINIEVGCKGLFFVHYLLTASLSIIP